MRRSHQGRDPYVYAFAELQHGDAIKVRSVPSAQEMFRRWREKHNKRHLKLRKSPLAGEEDILYCIDSRKPVPTGEEI
jgi:hypothetical protein